MKNMRREVTLKWTTPINTCPPRPNKSNFHMRKSSFYNRSCSTFFFAGFGVCSDDWRKKEKEEEKMINTKENGKDNLKEQMFEQEKKISKRKGKRK